MASIFRAKLQLASTRFAETTACTHAAQVGVAEENVSGADFAKHDLHPMARAPR